MNVRLAVYGQAELLDALCRKILKTNKPFFVVAHVHFQRKQTLQGLSTFKQFLPMQFVLLNEWLDVILHSSHVPPSLAKNGKRSRGQA